jgi:hypothetical protein
MSCVVYRRKRISLIVYERYFLKETVRTQIKTNERADQEIESEQV